MKFDKETIKTKKFQKLLGRLTLTLLIILLVLKFIIGHCELWLCGLFVLTVVGYFILSDYKGDNTKDK